MGKPKSKMGRPTLYTEELATDICCRVAAGDDVQSVCNAVGISLRTLHLWREVHEDFMQAYARARHRSGEASESRIQGVMDAVRNGEIDSNTARVLLDGEKWLAAKRAPRTHGDKIELEHSGQVNTAMLVTVNVQSHLPATPEAIDVTPAAKLLPEGK